MNMLCSSTTSSRLCLFLILLTTSFISAHTIDTIIRTSQTLSDNVNDTLISSNGAFALGFYSPPNSKNRYVGIWYDNMKDRTVVWVANRDDPLPDRSGVLRVVEPGRLLLLSSATNATIWSANTSRSAQNSPLARLLDSGNLVVVDESDESNIIWQSFDYPTDTFLPGMKLGKNFVSGHEVYVSSAKSNDDPATGGFTYRCDPSGYPQTVIKDGDSFRYKAGPWNGVSFSGTPNLVKNALFSFGVVINENEVYYNFQLLKDDVYTRLVLNEFGFGQRLIWSDQTRSWKPYLAFPNDNCDSYKVCGAHGICSTRTWPECSCLDKFMPANPQGWKAGNFSNGCIRRTPLNCEDGGNGFLKYSGVKLPDTEGSWYSTSMSLEECKVSCAGNCSCTAYASLDISNGESGCLLWFGELVNMREISPGQDIYIRMAKSELGSGSRKREIIIVSLSVVTGIVLLGVGLFLFYRVRKNPKHQQQETDNLRNSSETYEEQKIQMFELSAMINATNGFSVSNKLGEGGFGPVFKGLLEGQDIAVKRLSTTSLQGAHEFKNELICIAKLQHRNLVKLLGCCIEGEERMLVYEYMNNKSLDLILFDQVKRRTLDWPRRFDIINGIARGLTYLHQDSRLRVIHRDLKASNILLDSDMIPKISDFGLARICGGNETGAKTSRVVGTYGYMSPEYAVDGLFSVKSDVFSFGVLVLEIISGKRNRGFTMVNHRHNLVGHAWMLYKEERSLELVDSCLECSSYLSQVARSIHVGLLCVQEEMEERPNMSSVVLLLNNDGALPQPKHPGFFTGRDVVMRSETWHSSNTAGTANAMTISQLEAR